MIRILTPRGFTPRTPNPLSREPLRRLAPFAWLASLRSLAASFAAATLMRQAVNHVVDAELVSLVRCVEWKEALAGPFPVFRNVVVEVCDDHQALRRIVVLKHS